MTEGGHGHEPLTPDEEATVARMLAEAGGPVRMPDDVVARLDAVLAGLGQERWPDPDETVVELRSRRRWPRVLLGAAAVVIGGYAVGTVATQGSLGGSDEPMSAASDSGGSDSAASEKSSDPGDRAGGASSQSEGSDSGTAEEGPATSPAPQSDSDGAGAGGGSSDTMMLRTIRLRSDSLDMGVRRALEVLGTSARRAELVQGLVLEQPCSAPEMGRRDRSLPVRYDGEAAVLVAGPERRGTVEVTVWSCAGDELASTLVRP
jgi:hypothetical protein